MTNTESTHEEESMLEHIVHVHLSERRFEVEEFDMPLSEDVPPGTVDPSDRGKAQKTRKGPSQ